MSDTSEPVIEAPAADAPETPVPATEAPESTVPATEAPETPDDPFEPYGGKDTIEAAHRLYEASKTEDGVISLFLEAGRNLGLGLKDMQALFTDLGGAEPEEEPDPDEPLTRREFQETLTKQQQAAQEAQEAAATEVARQTVQATIKDLGLDIADPVTQVVLKYGDAHMKGDLTPENVAAAVRAGHADYQAAIEKEAQAYLAKKVAAGAGVPSAPAGNAAPAEQPEAEPKDVAEAIKQARKKLGLNR